MERGLATAGKKSKGLSDTHTHSKACRLMPGLHQGGVVGEGLGICRQEPEGLLFEALT